MHGLASGMLVKWALPRPRRCVSGRLEMHDDPRPAHRMPRPHAALITVPTQWHAKRGTCSCCLRRSSVAHLTPCRAELQISLPTVERQLPHRLGAAILV